MRSKNKVNIQAAIEDAFERSIQELDKFYSQLEHWRWEVEKDKEEIEEQARDLESRQKSND